VPPNNNTSTQRDGDRRDYGQVRAGARSREQESDAKWERGAVGSGDSLKTIADRQFVSRLSEVSRIVRAYVQPARYPTVKFMIHGHRGDKRMST